jgi:hypothetical protein
LPKRRLRGSDSAKHVSRRAFKKGDSERRFAISGAALLFSGFALQLIGYAWTFSSWWMLGYAIVVSISAGFFALRGARAVTTKFHRRAEELMRKAVE